MKRTQLEEVKSAIVGNAYPIAEPLGNRFVRHWVVRLECQVPEQMELDLLAERLAALGKEAIASTQGADASTAVAERVPEVRILPIATKHCVVSIQTPTAERAVGPDAAVGTWLVLRGLDDALGISDLQGIPKELWFQLR